MTRESALFTEAELRALLEREEGQFLEFKSLWDQEGVAKRTLDRRKVRDFVAEYAAAFANSDGGTLLLGVEDDGSPTGHGYPDEAVAEFLAVPERRLQPPLRCRTQRARLDRYELLVLDVPIAPEAVMVEGDGFPYRAGDRVVREPQEMINERKQAYRRVGYEKRFHPDATLDDLDLELAARFLARTVVGQRSIEELLERYGLIQPRPRGWAVTQGALLLFAKPPLARWHPRAAVRFFRVAGSERKHGAERNVTQLERIELPIASAISEAQRYAATQVRRSEKLHDLFFRETPEYPEFAWQEAIVNAIAHRDYEVQGQEIEVWFYEDRMEVKSPGALVPPVTIDFLRERVPVHASRNPLLVRVLVESGVMREEGEGLPRIFDEMERSFLCAPELAAEHGGFQVTLFNVPIFVGPSMEWQKLVGELSISTAQKRVLLARPVSFTNEDYRELNQVDRDEAYRQIQELVQLGLVQAQGAARGAHYTVSPDLRQARSFLEARLPALRVHFRNHERLTNTDFRRLFGLARYRAASELRRLVDEGFLRLEGAKRGAHYRATPRLRLEAGE